jgi:PEP-CTERM motif
MRTATFARTCASLFAAGIFVTGVVAESAKAATLVLPSASLPLIGVAYQSTGAGAGCFTLVGACVTPGPFVLTAATSVFVGGNQLIRAEATYSATLTTPVGNRVVGSVSLTGTLYEAVFGRTSNSEIGSFPTDIASISLSGPLSLPGTPLDGYTLSLALNPSDTSSGVTTIAPDGALFKVDSSFDVFVDASLANPSGTVIASRDLPGITLVAVPEASTWAMLLAGFAGLGLAASSRKRAANPAG